MFWQQDKDHNQYRKNKADFAIVYQKYFDAIYRYIYFRVPKDQAEDLTATVFTKVWENMTNLADDSNISAWIYRIAHNTVVDFYKTHKTLSEISEEFGDDKANINHIQEQKLNTKLLKKYLFRLSKNKRDVLTLKYLNNFSNEDIAAMLGLSMSNTRVMQHRALKELKEYMIDDGITL